MMQQQSTSDNKINQAIDTCNPDLLIEAILHASVKLESDRNNVKLLGKIKDIFGKGVTAVNHKLAEIDRSETANQAKAAGDAIIEIHDATFLEPRGKFSCSMSMSGIHLNGSGATKVSCFIPLDLISHMALVPNNATTKKEGEDYLCIRLSQPVKCNGKDLKSFLWVLGKAEAKQPQPQPSSTTSAECKVEAINAAENTSKESGGPKTESDKVSTILASLCSDIKLIKPNVDLFKSLTKQKSYVNCYKGIQEGVLYPLENGLLFVKPMLFIPVEEILSMVAGRGGGSNTRFVDLIVETSDKTETEFTNFEREELGSLQWYIDWLKRAQRKKLAALEAVKAETSSSAKKGENTKEKSDTSMESSSNNKKDDDDDNNDDDDDNSDDDDSDASEDNKGGYFKDVEDSDDEDDDDFNPEGGSSDGSGSDSSDNSSDDGSAFSGSWDGSDSGDSIEKKIKSKSKPKRSLDKVDDTGSEDDGGAGGDDSNSRSSKPAKKRSRDTASK